MRASCSSAYDWPLAAYMSSPMRNECQPAPHPAARPSGMPCFVNRYAQPFGRASICQSTIARLSPHVYAMRCGASTATITPCSGFGSSKNRTRPPRRRSISTDPHPIHASSSLGSVRHSHMRSTET